jgi:hypothetical protein
MVKSRLKPRMFDAVQQAAGFAPMFDRGFVTLNARTTQHLRLNCSWRFLHNDTDFANRSAAGAAPLDFRPGPSTVEGGIQLECAGELRRIRTPSATADEPAVLIGMDSFLASGRDKKGGAGATWVPAIYRNGDFV